MLFMTQVSELQQLVAIRPRPREGPATIVPVYSWHVCLGWSSHAKIDLVFRSAGIGQNIPSQRKYMYQPTGSTGSTQANNSARQSQLPIITGSTRVIANTNSILTNQVNGLGLYYFKSFGSSGFSKCIAQERRPGWKLTLLLGRGKANQNGGKIRPLVI